MRTSASLRYMLSAQKKEEVKKRSKREMVEEDEIRTRALSDHGGIWERIPKEP